MSLRDNNTIKIIVVDDEQIVLSLVCDTLDEEGYQVESASNGMEALEKIKEKEFDLIITDIRMPHMSGIELVKQTREKYPDISVIFMTGYANLNTAKDAIKQGAVDYIMKPFEIHEMRQAVQNTVKLRREADQKDSVKQLGHLSDLNQMLYTAGDKKSLLVVSLRFAMMHCNSKRGMILNWNSHYTKVSLIMIENEQVEENDIKLDTVPNWLKELDVDIFQKPAVVSNLDEYPVFHGLEEEQLYQLVDKHWFTSNNQVAILPINRASLKYGIMMVGFDEVSATVMNANIKFLSLTSNQMAMSMENLELLEEAQDAFVKLKELQDETIQLEKMATRGEMSAEIGHELNNFLGVVAGNLSLLDFQLKKENYTELERYVKATIDTVEKIKKFTSNLMDLTPISSEQEVINFERLLTEVIDYLKPQKRFDGVTIIFEPKGLELPFKADVIHIQQLLYNLFNNAADAMIDRDHKEITARLETNGSNRFKVSITDSGCGIDPENLTRVFNERFTTKKTGHGHGLVVCKRIIDNHGGELEINSTIDVGTTISIDFPLTQHEAVTV